MVQRRRKMIHAFYNTSAGAHYSADAVMEKIKGFFPGDEVALVDTLTVDNKQEYIDKLSTEDKVVIVGGDGTLNRFVNSIADKEYPFEIYCYAAGTGNDFIVDVIGKGKDEPVLINKYITKLPEIEVNGKTYKYLNGIGYGIDGWCADEGEKARARTGNPPNYTSIAIKGLFGAYSPVNAKVTIDGVVSEYKNVWMVPAMNGRYFGGGMMITPSQDRLNEERNIMTAIVTCKSRIRLLTVFPKIFEGKHAKYTKIVKFVTAKEIKVEYDRPVALQIDGETVQNVTTYTARSWALLNKEAETV